MTAFAHFSPVPNKPVYEPNVIADLTRLHVGGIIAKFGSGAVVTCNGAVPGEMILYRTPDGIDIRCEGSTLASWCIHVPDRPTGRPFFVQGTILPPKAHENPIQFAQLVLEHVLRRNHQGGIFAPMIQLPVGELTVPVSSPASNRFGSK